MTLYSQNGGTPAPLPAKLILPDGTTRTGSGRTPEAIAAAGYVEAPARPSGLAAHERAVWHPDTLSWTVEDRDLPTVQADTLRNIRAQAENRLRPLLDEYTEPERLSWERQLAQARDFEADSNAATPLLDALANARGLTRQQMADKITAAAQQFEAASGAIIGTQQAAEDAAKAATTAEAAYKARNVTWPTLT